MRRKREEHGQGLVEYALILVGIAIVVILILNIMGVSVKEAYCKVITDLGGKTCEANGECSFSFDDPSGLDTWEGNNKEQLSIEDGRACINGNGTNARSYLNPNCSSSLESNDYTITYEDITVERAIDNDKNTGLDTWFRAKDDKNGYLFIYNSRTNYVRFWKVVDGRWVKFSESKVPSSWQNESLDIKLDVQGDNFTAYKDGQEILKASDGAYEDGQVGIRNKPSSKSCIGNMTVESLVP